MPDREPPSIEDLRAKVAEIELGRQPDPLHLWLVVSWYAPGGFWKLWPTTYNNHDAAVRKTVFLPRGHTHARIVEVVDEMIGPPAGVRTP